MRRSRMLGWDRNPLRRRIDRLEAAMIAGLIVLFLISAPVLVATVGHGIRSAAAREDRAEVAWRPVPAIVQGPRQRDDFLESPGTVGMLAQWRAPDGQARRGWIPVSPETTAGSRVQVWVSPWGSLTGQPLQRAQVQGQLAITGVVTVFLLGVLLGLIGWAGRYLFRRRRHTDWDRTWRAVEPQWTRPR